MNAVDRLRRDHKTLRGKLDVVESALKLGPDAFYVLREVCFTLAKQVRDHMRREEELVVLCRQKLPPHLLADFAFEHKDEPAHLRTINRLFISEPGHTLERIRPALTAVIDGLRHHMAEEERELFPRLEAAIDLIGPAPARAAAPHAALEPSMTVNRVIHEFPGTRRLFERLFVNLEAEGCNCLDEVAWTHGMDCRELLEHVERTIHACECTTKTAPASSEADRPVSVA